MNSCPRASSSSAPADRVRRPESHPSGCWTTRRQDSSASSSRIDPFAVGTKRSQPGILKLLERAPRMLSCNETVDQQHALLSGFRQRDLEVSPQMRHLRMVARAEYPKPPSDLSQPASPGMRRMKPPTPIRRMQNQRQPGAWRNARPRSTISATSSARSHTGLQKARRSEAGMLAAASASANSLVASPNVLGSARPNSALVCSAQTSIFIRSAVSASRALRKLCISLGSNASGRHRARMLCGGPSDAILAAISSISSWRFSKSSGDQVSGASRECSDVLELSLERIRPPRSRNGVSPLVHAACASSQRAN